MHIRSWSAIVYDRTIIVGRRLTEWRNLKKFLQSCYVYRNQNIFAHISGRDVKISDNRWKYSDYLWRRNSFVIIYLTHVNTKTRFTLFAYTGYRPMYVSIPRIYNVRQIVTWYFIFLLSCSTRLQRDKRLCLCLYTGQPDNFTDWLKSTFFSQILMDGFHGFCNVAPWSSYSFAFFFLL